MKYWTPEQIILGLERQEGQPPKYIIENMMLNFERQAREVLTRGGYGVDGCYLTPNEPEQDRQTWLNEAFQLMGGYDLCFEDEQAAITLIESSNLQDLLSKEETSAIAISMAKLMAIALLPHDTDMTAINEEYKNRPRKAGQKPKRSKGIRAAYEEIRNSNPGIKAIDCWNELQIMANEEAEITDKEGNIFVLKIEEYATKSKDPETDCKLAERIFSEDFTTCKRDGRPVTLSTLQDWYTKDKKLNNFL